MNSTLKLYKAVLARKNILLTGGGGVGKTWHLNYLRKALKGARKFSMTASTGIASTHIDGMTIHSFSGIGGISKVEDVFRRINSRNWIEKAMMLRNTDILVIDEVSMLRSDFFKALDIACKKAKNNKKPFGGIQLVLVGDFLQLPPVVKHSEKEFMKNPWCFQTQVFQEAEFDIHNLKEVKRQDNPELIEALNEMRMGKVSDKTDKLFRELYKTEFPKGVVPVKLFATNKEVDKLNQEELEKIETENVFRSNAIVKTLTSSYFKEFTKETIIPLDLKLKQFCRVMILKNDTMDFKYVNGSMGYFLGIEKRTFHNGKFEETGDCLKIKLDNGKIVFVGKGISAQTENPDYEPEFDHNGKEIETDEKYLGRMWQYPVRLGYAITAHKSQGMTLDYVEIDCRKFFSAGQMYVACSRGKSLEGMRVINWDRHLVFADRTALQFYKYL